MRGGAAAGWKTMMSTGFLLVGECVLQGVPPLYSWSVSMLC